MVRDASEGDRSGPPGTAREGLARRIRPDAPFDSSHLKPRSGRGPVASALGAAPLNLMARGRRISVERRGPDAWVVLVRGGTEVASWPLTAPGRPDLHAVDRLASLQLVARRWGCSIRLRDASVELLALLDFVGLGDVVDVVVRRAGVGETDDCEPDGVDDCVVPDDPVS
jgi:hypothetical protein